MLESGVYKLQNKTTGNFYIGSTFIFNKRFGEHINALRGNYHRNRYLQNSYNKYGEGNFEFYILATCPIEYLSRLEKWFIDTLKPKYNILRESTFSHLGVKRSVETRDKQSISKLNNTNALGAVRSQDFRDNLSKRLLGHKLTVQTKTKISNSLTGQKQDTRTIRKRIRKLYRKVKFTTNGIATEYKSIKHASIATGISRSHITLCCQKKKRCSSGKWEYV